jgi:K+-transporting ATPase ATPase C chain
MRRQLFPALGMVVVFTVITGLMYPLLVTGFAQTAFHDEANGSLVRRNGTIVGSRWIGQSFTEPRYFHPRPHTDAYQSPRRYAAGSNDGPTNEAFLHGADDPTTEGVDESKTTGVDDLVRAYRRENGLPRNAAVPVDAVTGSASGLDPHISVANARLQARRVAHERGLSRMRVLRLIDDHTDGRALGFLGEPGVNVLGLNLALDRI